MCRAFRHIPRLQKGAAAHQNVYTQTSMEIRREAVETLASAFVN
jgi:hypothetical protein